MGLMKTSDLYTKCVLTIIAVALSAIAIENLLSLKAVKAADNQLIISGYTWNGETRTFGDHYPYTGRALPVHNQ
jgi:hypothetical protein